MIVELTNENYHSVEARKNYMGYSQFKMFLECEKHALDYVNGNVSEEKTDALLFGSYVDAYFSEELDDFLEKHRHDIYNSRTGELKSAFKNLQNVIDAIESDEMLHKYLKGQHQVIMTGVISGVPFKIKIDSYFPGKCIVDQKVMRDMKPVWIEENGRNVKVNFAKAYRYDLEGAIYQEIVRQNTGQKLPFILDVATKEEVPDKALLQIDQDDLDAALKEVETLAPRFAAIKRGEIKPEGCGKCDTCKKEKKITGIFSFHDYDPDHYDDEY